LADRHIKKDKVYDSADPIDAFRSIHFKIDNRTNEEKVKDSVAEAGHETRSVNQVVKLVNMSISEKVKKLEKLKQDSKRFDEELNMFTSGLNEPPKPTQSVPQNMQTLDQHEIEAISKELLGLINKYGAKKLSTAFDKVLSDLKI
jgi:tRNA nucleotidyltransferase/poly(A) polymerase